MEKRHEVLFIQLASYRNELLSLIEDLSEKEVEIIPTGFNNNIRWNLGHVYLDQYLWIESLTKEETLVPKEFLTWFGFGTNPTSFTDQTPTLKQLKKLLKEQPTHIKETYGKRLDEEFSPTEMGMYTLEQVLIRTIFHEGMHMQAIMDLKNFIK
ncbi:DinB family protein [Evansella tamaricis]|uniref:DinB family protein n=1 Tax=Evansella tamaricis TaxID=2069301 RepID=A0ABS6JHP3_9BACI|nr:DinB family protein [Evansella tamaricis]MBU9713111.1 DinB family protein [Evansella tamaricis]